MGSQGPWQATGFPGVYGMMDPDDSSSKANTNQKIKALQGFSANLKQILDGIPKLACVIVAVWDYLHTRDIERFVLLLAIGHTASYSLPKLKALAPKVGTLAKAIAELLDKLK
jgi:hypothetical protein